MIPQNRYRQSREKTLCVEISVLKLHRAKIENDLRKLNRALAESHQRMKMILAAEIIPDGIIRNKRKPIDGNGRINMESECETANVKRSRVECLPLPRGLSTGRPQNEVKALLSLQQSATTATAPTKSTTPPPPPMCTTPPDVLLNTSYTDSAVAPEDSSPPSPPIDVVSSLGKIKDAAHADGNKTTASTLPTPSTAPPIDVASLFQNLVKNGLIANSTGTSSPQFSLPNLSTNPLTAKTSVFDALRAQTRNFTTPPPNFHNPASLQMRNASAIDALYSSSAPVKNYSTAEPNQMPKLPPSFQNPAKSYSFPSQNRMPNLGDPASLKIRRTSIINALHSGMQCSNCCTRFNVNDVVAYQAHLDEHFKENRREKQKSKTGEEWYLPTSQWITLGDRSEANAEKPEKNWFEKQQLIQEKNRAYDDDLFGKNLKCIANDDEQCCVCSDPFEIYFDDADEEWMLRNAMRVDGKVYHAICHKESLE